MEVEVDGGKEENEEKQTKKPNWWIKEDQMLCIAWLNTSNGTNVSMGQNNSAFW